MKNSIADDAIARNNKYCLRTALILPAIALLALTGCSTLGGFSGEPSLTKNNQTYLQQNARSSDPDADSPDPGYEWFY
jgi:hypothetical protein